jgi:hypothetical protein
MKPRRKEGGSRADDPQKGRWGGLAECNGRKLTAVIKETRGEGFWFEVMLTVQATDPNNKLQGMVVFHLHDTFTPDERVVAVRNGEAVLNFYAWGAFTVGVEADEGRTRLELDLASVPRAPKEFIEL